MCQIVCVMRGALLSLLTFVRLGQVSLARHYYAATTLKKAEKHSLLQQSLYPRRCTGVRAKKRTNAIGCKHVGKHKVGG